MRFHDRWKGRLTCHDIFVLLSQMKSIPHSVQRWYEMVSLGTDAVETVQDTGRPRIRTGL